MEISVTEAKAHLTDLVRRAEAGDEIVLTRHGKAAIRLVPVKAVPLPDAKRSLIAAIRQSARHNATDGLDAARSQDFLYDEAGQPK